MYNHVRDAVRRAVTWLRENPNKHAKGRLAFNSIGYSVAPTDPTAECFCVLGRISKELDCGGYPGQNSDFHRLLIDIGISETVLFMKNDRSVRGLTTCGANRGNPNVLDYIEKELLA